MTGLVDVWKNQLSWDDRLLILAAVWLIGTILRAWWRDHT